MPDAFDMNTRIALIHATALAVQPINDAFASSWADAELVNILDDSLSIDRERAGAIDDAMFDRFERLVRYAGDIGAKGILFTCSAFGPAIERAAQSTKRPVLKPNEAMFDEVLSAASGTGRIGMVATFAPSVDSMRCEFDDAASARRLARTLDVALAPGAMAAMKNGDADMHDRLIVEAALRLGDCDAIMLAQFSMARAKPKLQSVTATPVHTSPDSAVTRMRALLSG